jgi:D-proline reductase (dithiol) PrdB
MVRLTDLSERLATIYANLDHPEFETNPWVEGPPLAERRIAMVSSAGLGRRGDRLFIGNKGDYRELPSDTPAGEIVMSHVSLGYDRTGFMRDINVAFPIDRLRELADEGVIGGIGPVNYSFMGATDPVRMEASVREVAGKMKDSGVDSVALFPV